ncbi:MAG TPA: AzlD domain-containing protein [Thermomicrobiales bacterium]
MRVEVVATILGMALITYATRAGGLWLMGRIQPTPRLERWLRSLPGAILAALVAPAALAAGPAEAIAAVLTALLASRTGNLLAALIGGVASVYILRQLL